MKFVLFLSIMMTGLVDKCAKICINEVVRLHEIPVSIVLDGILGLPPDFG
jgi:hypothetical protein